MAASLIIALPFPATRQHLGEFSDVVTQFQITPNNEKKQP